MKYFIALDLFVIVNSKALCNNAGKDAFYNGFVKNYYNGIEKLFILH